MTAKHMWQRALFSARTAAKRNTGLDDDKNSWRTVTAGVSSRLVTSRILQIAFAASKYHHLCLVSQARFQKLIEWTRLTA